MPCGRLPLLPGEGHDVDGRSAPAGDRPFEDVDHARARVPVIESRHRHARGVRVTDGDDGNGRRHGLQHRAGSAVVGAVMTDCEDIDVEKPRAGIVAHQVGDGGRFKVAGDQERGRSIIHPDDEALVVGVLELGHGPAGVRLPAAGQDPDLRIDGRTINRIDDRVAEAVAPQARICWSVTATTGIGGCAAPARWTRAARRKSLSPL
jgi:hypothetical protein